MIKVQFCCYICGVKKKFHYISQTLSELWNERGGGWILIITSFPSHPLYLDNGDTFPLMNDLCDLIVESCWCPRSCKKAISNVDRETVFCWLSQWHNNPIRVKRCGYIQQCAKYTVPKQGLYWTLISRLRIDQSWQFNRSINAYHSISSPHSIYILESTHDSLLAPPLGSADFKANVHCT